MVSTTCRAFSGSVLSRWLLSQRHREGGVLRLVRSIAIKDLVTRLGAALRSASSGTYRARSLARSLREAVYLHRESNAPGVVALPLLFFSFFSLLFLYFSRGRCGVGWLGNISFNSVFESRILWAYLSTRGSLHAARRICTSVLARTSLPSSSRVIESLIQMASLSVTEAEFEGSERASREWHH